MKNICTLLAAVLLTATTYAQVGINIETPDASAVLDVTSTTAGFLMPRMTNAQRQAISNPAAGLQVFVTDFEGGRFMFYDGTEWGTLSFTEKRPDAPTIGTASAAVIHKPQFHLQPHQVMEAPRLLPTQLPQAQEILQEQLVSQEVAA